MTKEQFLFQLEQLLRELPQEEREEALCYYRDYFDDAGTENEAAVIAELGAPEQVAASIKEGLNGSHAGTVGQPPQMWEMASGSGRGAERRKQPERRRKWLLLLFIAVVTCPLWMSLLGTLLGVIVAVLMTVIVVCVAGVLLAGAGLIGGVVTVIIGVARFFTAGIVSGLMTVGVGMLLAALGCLSSVCMLLLFGKFVPWLCRVIFRANLLRNGREQKKKEVF